MLYVFVRIHIYIYIYVWTFSGWRSLPAARRLPDGARGQTGNMRSRLGRIKKFELHEGCQPYHPPFRINRDELDSLRSFRVFRKEVRDSFRDQGMWASFIRGFDNPGSGNRGWKDKGLHALGSPWMSPGSSFLLRPSGPNVPESCLCPCAWGMPPLEQWDPYWVKRLGTQPLSTKNGCVRESAASDLWQRGAGPVEDAAGVQDSFGRMDTMLENVYIYIYIYIYICIHRERERERDIAPGL